MVRHFSTRISRCARCALWLKTPQWRAHLGSIDALTLTRFVGPKAPGAGPTIVCILTILLSTAAGVDTAWAQSTGSSLELQPPSVYTGRPDLFGKPSAGDEALPIGNWLVFPSSFVGFLYATNPSESSTGAHAS